MRKFILTLAIFFSLTTQAHALNVFTSSFLMNNSTGNQAITGVGFQPKVVIFFSALKADPQGNADDIAYMFGAAASSTKRFSSGAADINYGQASPATKDNFSNVLCIYFYSKPLVGYAAADFVSQDSDGFTINVTTAASATYRIFYVALGGSDLTADVGSFTAPAGTGNQSYTGVGFRPNAMIFSSFANSVVTTENNWQNYIGWATSLNQGVVITRGTGASTYNAGTQFNSQQLSTSCLGGVAGGANDGLANFVSNDADGWTLNWTNTGGSYVHGYIALKGANVKVGSFSENTSTGNQSVSGVGFQPSLVMFNSQSKASTSSIQTSYTSQMFGVATSSSSRRVFAVQDSNGVPSGQCQRRTSEALCLTHITGTAVSASPTVNAEADFVSMDTDGFTINMSTADATSREVLYMAIGQATTVNQYVNLYNTKIYNTKIYG